MPAAIVLEIRGLPYKRTELDELARVGAPTVLLCGVFEERELFAKYKWHTVLRRPFTIGQVVEAVKNIVEPGCVKRD